MKPDVHSGSDVLDLSSPSEHVCVDRTGPEQNCSESILDPDEGNIT